MSELVKVSINKPLAGGYGFAALAALCWAAPALLAPGKNGAGAALPVSDPLTLALLLTGPGGFLLFFTALLSGGKSLFAFSFEQFTALAFFGVLMFAGAPFCLFSARAYAPAENVAAVLAFAPVLILLFGMAVGEQVDLPRLFGLFLVFAGSLFVTGVLTRKGIALRGTDWRGEGFATGAVCCWALAAVTGVKLLKNGSVLAATAWALLFGCAFLLVVLPFRGVRTLALPASWSDLGTVLLLVSAPAALGGFFWNLALARTGLYPANFLQTLTGVLALLLPPLIGLDGVRVTPFAVAGAVLIGGGIVIAAGSHGTRAAASGSASGKRRAD